jgi:hypothetical protein
MKYILPLSLSERENEVCCTNAKKTLYVYVQTLIFVTALVASARVMVPQATFD